jgi:hypothetical protein
MGDRVFDDDGKVIDREGLLGIGIGKRAGVFKRTDESSHLARVERVEGRDVDGKEVRSLNITPMTRDLGRED